MCLKFTRTFFHVYNLLSGPNDRSNNQSVTITSDNRSKWKQKSYLSILGDERIEITSIAWQGDRFQNNF